jgi:hypothetical protein
MNMVRRSGYGPARGAPPVIPTFISSSHTREVDDLSRVQPRGRRSSIRLAAVLKRGRLLDRAIGAPQDASG